MKKTMALVFALFLLLGATARPRFITLFLADQRFTVEVADTVEKQLRGLMFRASIADDYGMLFPYPDEDIRGFWMKNTLVHLDLIFIDSGRTVVEIIANVPPCRAEPCETYISSVPARYVLEIRGGLAAELGVKVGDRVLFKLQP